MAEPRVTYEVWERNLATGKAYPYFDHKDYTSPESARAIADGLKGNEVQAATAEARHIRRYFTVVKATTTFEEVL